MPKAEEEDVESLEEFDARMNYVPPICSDCGSKTREIERLHAERAAWMEAAGVSAPQYLADRLAALDALYDFARHPKADSLMRATLGPKMFSHLWGPELEALGHAVDLALGTAEKAEAQVRERQAALDLLTMRTATGQLCFRTANGIPMGMPKTTERKVEALLATKEPKR